MNIPYKSLRITSNISNNPSTNISSGWFIKTNTINSISCYSGIIIIWIPTSSIINRVITNISYCISITCIKSYIISNFNSWNSIISSFGSCSLLCPNCSCKIVTYSIAIRSKVKVSCRYRYTIYIKFNKIFVFYSNSKW